MSVFSLRLPASGNILESALTALGAPPGGSPGGLSVTTASEAQLREAIDAMSRGDIEFVIVERGEEFLQAAGEGDGPYALQHSAGSSGKMTEVRGGVSAETVRKVLVAYSGGEEGWKGEVRWTEL
jgi:hypothetical protein